MKSFRITSHVFCCSLYNVYLSDYKGKAVSQAPAPFSLARRSRCLLKFVDFAVVKHLFLQLVVFVIGLPSRIREFRKIRDLKRSS